MTGSTGMHSSNHLIDGHIIGDIRSTTREQKKKGCKYAAALELCSPPLTGTFQKSIMLADQFPPQPSITATQPISPKPIARSATQKYTFDTHHPTLSWITYLRTPTETPARPGPPPFPYANTQLSRLPRTTGTPDSPQTRRFHQVRGTAPEQKKD